MTAQEALAGRGGVQRQSHQPSLRDDDVAVAAVAEAGAAGVELGSCGGRGSRRVAVGAEQADRARAGELELEVDRAGEALTVPDHRERAVHHRGRGCGRTCPGRVGGCDVERVADAVSEAHDYARVPGGRAGLTAGLDGYGVANDRRPAVVAGW